MGGSSSKEEEIRINTTSNLTGVFAFYDYNASSYRKVTIYVHPDKYLNKIKDITRTDFENFGILYLYDYDYRREVPEAIKAFNPRENHLLTLLSTLETEYKLARHRSFWEKLKDFAVKAFEVIRGIATVVLAITGVTTASILLIA